MYRDFLNSNLAVQLRIDEMLYGIPRNVKYDIIERAYHRCKVSPMPFLQCISIERELYHSTLRILSNINWDRETDKWIDYSRNKIFGYKSKAKKTNIDHIKEFIGFNNGDLIIKTLDSIMSDVLKGLNREFPKMEANLWLNL